MSYPKSGQKAQFIKNSLKSKLFCQLLNATLCNSFFIMLQVLMDKFMFLK